tara:strand:+ start:432 stop:779 length:348 start_codon:yes stop_codon:yes gene_type:complete
MIKPNNPNLIEITSPIQAERGNRQFFDQDKKVHYISYSNGYVRREIRAIYTLPWNGSSYPVRRQYQLNRVEKQGSSNRRIMEPSESKRMEMIDRLSAQFKGPQGMFSGSNHTLIK